MKNLLKKSVFLGIVCLALMSMGAAFYSGSNSTAVFEWNETEHNFGKVKVNEPAEHTFVFKNKGDVPLIIHSVKASCGCTVAKYSKEPIGVNESGFVTAKYNSAKVGHFSKTVTVTSNTENETISLVLKGEVVE